MESGLKITVKTTTQEASFTIQAANDWNVEHLEKVIRLHLKVHDNQRVRLLHGGKLLSNKSELLSSCLNQAFENGAVVHCSISEGSDISINMNELQEADEVNRGFNRLLEAGFTNDEIEELRNQFVQVRGGNVTANDEERWLTEVIEGERGGGRGGDEGNELKYEEVFVGLLMGFLFPPLIVFAKSMTKYTRGGLMIGMISNITIFICRALFSSF